VQDVWTLIARDHHELVDGLASLAEQTASDPRGTIDGLCLGFAAHAEAHARTLESVLGGRALPPHVAALVRELESAHLAQERQFARLAYSPGEEWPSRARVLHDMIRQHHDYERAWCLPVLRTRATDYENLAARYATERLRAFAWTWRSEAPPITRAPSGDR
jgi:hypothetical protein